MIETLLEVLTTKVVLEAEKVAVVLIISGNVSGGVEVIVII